MMKNNLPYVVLLFIWVFLAVFFGFYDLNISIHIVNQNSNWAKFLENYGMIPGLLVILSGIFIYYSFIKSKSNARSYIQRVVLFLVSSGLIFYMFEILLGKIVTNNMVVFLIISFSIGLIILMIIHKMGKVNNPIIIMYGKAVVGMALFGYVIFIQGIKYIWGRVRFRELDAAFSQFTPWYSPQGFTGFDSFPSGHAAMGWILLATLILFENKKPGIKSLALSLIIFWGILLALSRVVIGAHYASDVLFGSFFIIITFLYFRYKSSTN